MKTQIIEPKKLTKRLTTEYIELKKHKEMIKDFIKYYKKRKKGKKLTYYEIRLKEILEEYDYILEYKEIWKND